MSKSPRTNAAEAVSAPPVRSRQTPAMMLSFGLHLALLCALFWVASSVTKGTGEVDRQIGIAMIHQLPDRETYVEVEAKVDAPTDIEATEVSSSSAAAAPPADITPPIDLEGILSAMKSTPAPVSGSGLVGDSQLSGDAFGDGSGTGPMKPVGGKKGTTRLFGVSGSGSRFVYVMDRSDSMNGFGGLPLRSAKKELIRSLNSLQEEQQFQIIFYNEGVKPFRMAGHPLQMVSGEKGHLKRAEDYVKAIRAFGGTKHKSALLMALRMAPDVIFFMTDAHVPRLSRGELADVQRRAQRSGTTIHTVEFGSQASGSPVSFLRDLAAMNNGQYQYVDVRRLGGGPIGGTQ
ncbi:MAG: hypothetical protein AAFX06_21995 [Planctomycetota bacterium]